MQTWDETYQKLKLAAHTSRARFPFFRGHSRSDWKLLPAFARADKTKPGAAGLDVHQLENNVYFDFVTRAGELLTATDGWSVAFAMQHHGVPTRLLDWTETLAVALHFAIRGSDGDAAVWVLNPFALNGKTFGKRAVPHPHELHGTYTDFFIDRTKQLDAAVLALSPLRHNPRVFHQRSGFTLHEDIDTAIEVLCPEAVQKVVIPKGTHSDARTFLQHAGISEFTLFPDLDGLARDVNDDYFS